MDKKTFVAGLTIVLFLFALMPGPAHADPGTEPKPAPAITVTGTGAAAGAPNRADIRAGASAEKPSADAAMKAATAYSEKILSAARKFGIADKDIQTKSILLQPVYDRRNRNQPGEQPKLAGYRARLDHKLTTADIAGLGKLLDGLTAAGANQIGGIRLYVDDTRALTDQARKDAIKDARRAAGVLAGEAGMALGNVISITEGGQGGPGPVMMERTLSAAAPIAPGEVSYTVRVRVTFSLEPK